MAVLVLLAACGAHRGGEAARKVSFEVEGRPAHRAILGADSDRALRRQMEQVETSRLSLLLPGVFDPVLLDRGGLDDDGEALQVYLEGQGYFDARFDGWEVTPRGSPKRRLQPVSVRGTISEGEASRIRTVSITGIEQKRGKLKRKLRAASTLEVGDVFVSANYATTVAALSELLGEAGFAFATVTGRVDAWPAERSVDVEIAVDSGPKSRFGPVEITGANNVPMEVVWGAVAFEEGDAYSLEALADTRNALYGLGVFSVVNVMPSFANPDSALVPVKIDVRGNKRRRIKVGPGVEVETGKATTYAAAEWEHNNLFRRLWHFTQGVRLGASAVSPQTSISEAPAASGLTVAPIADLSSALTVPHVMGPSWSFEADARAQVGIEPGYQYFSPEFAPGLTWRPRTRFGRDALSLGLAYSVRYFDYFNFTVDIQDVVDSPLGLDLTDPYLLSALTQRLIVERRDDPMAPTRGWFASLALAEAGGPLFGSYNFLRVAAEIRGYRSLPTLRGWKPRLVVASRLGGGIIVPYGTGAAAGAPYAERLYLGGGTTVRGWGANRLGPSVAVTNSATGEEELLPAGGLFSLYRNFELRKYVAYGVSVAAFNDIGRVWPEVQDFSFDSLQWTVGGGLRYATVIGPVRADFGWQLGPPDDLLPDGPRWAIHFGLSEAF